MSQNSLGKELQDSFNRRWGLPIFFGVVNGFVTVLINMSKLIDQFGDAKGAVAGCALGVAVSLVTILLCRLIGRIFFPK